MKIDISNLKKIFTIIFFLVCCISCTNEDDARLKKAEAGILTEVNGNVKDYILNTNISEFRIDIEKTVYKDGSYYYSEVVGSINTDSNGNYTIKFMHNPRSDRADVRYNIVYGWGYNQDNDSYSVRYLNTTNLIKVGQSTTINLKATKRTELELTLNIVNNNNSPLRVFVNYSSMSLYFQILEQNITNIERFSSIPDEDIEFSFNYVTIVNNISVRHSKIVPYHTSLDAVDSFNYTLDCSTF